MDCMNKRNIKLNDRLYEVITPDQFINNLNLYELEFTAVLFEQSRDIYGNIIPAYVLPFRTPSMAPKQLPGIYGITQNMYGCPIFQVVYPFYYVPDKPGSQHLLLEIYKPEYFIDNNTMLDVTNVKQMTELIQLNTKYRQYENDIITTKDNVTVLKILPSNTPEMAAFKEAINLKRVDIDKYKFKLPATWANDKRFILNSDTITFSKLKSLLNAFGLTATLTIDNVSPDVANPIPHPITVNITGDINSMQAFMDEISNINNAPSDEDEQQEDMDYDY